MMKKITCNLLFSAFIMMLSATVSAQDTTSLAAKSAYQFELITEVPHTSVKNQYRSGTCWSFSGIGHVEAEILRLTDKTVDLSEMFMVRHVYADKAKKYIRLHGNLNLASGGGFSDIFHVIEHYGLITEEAYSGLVIGEENHTHGEMDDVLKAYTNAVMKNSNRKLSPVWFEGFESLLDTYLGKVPASFSVDGQAYTPMEFAAATGIKPADYIELTSYTHQAYYKPFIMELPDNWIWGQSYNLPLEEFLSTIDFALQHGYTVAWDADVSEKGFSWKNGIAIVPEENPENMIDTLQLKYASMTKADRLTELYSFKEIVPEAKITPETRQKSYDNYETTDDHNMLIVGLASDQNGNKYYKVKNSWGTEGHIYEGYFYASEAYVALKTLYITIHKGGIPRKTLSKLNF